MTKSTMSHPDINKSPDNRAYRLFVALAAGDKVIVAPAAAG
jgi:hypothetical protein